MFNTVFNILKEKMGLCRNIHLPTKIKFHNWSNKIVFYLPPALNPNVHRINQATLLRFSFFLSYQFSFSLTRTRAEF